MSDHPSDATMAAARRVFDQRPRNAGEAFEIARRLYPHATPEALSGITRLALLFAAPKVPEVPPLVRVTPIADGRVRFVPEATPGQASSSPEE
jgi:hypothetical protein